MALMASASLPLPNEYEQIPSLTAPDWDSGAATAGVAASTAAVARNLRREVSRDMNSPVRIISSTMSSEALSNVKREAGMDRRQFMGAAGVVGLAAQASGQGQSFVQTPAFTEGRGFDKEKVRRVGLIGCGWYGKIDLLRLIQISPVEVLSLCDVDKNILNEAGQIVAGRQRSKKVPRLYSDYRE